MITFDRRQRSVGTLKSALIAKSYRAADEFEAATCSADVLAQQLRQRSEPLVLRGFALRWPAVSHPHRKWADFGGLAQRLRLRGESVVRAEIGAHYMDPQLQLTHVGLESFLRFIALPEAEQRRALQARMFIAQQDLMEIPVLRDDIDVPHEVMEAAAAPTSAAAATAGVSGLASAAAADQHDRSTGAAASHGSRRLHRCNLWLSTALGSESPCHHDPYNNLLCQVVGRKQVRLFPPECGRYLYPHAAQSRQQNTSSVDLLRPDRRRHPLFAQAEAAGRVAELVPGDALFLPLRWWHHCRSDGVSCSVNFWWT